ncbi:HpcH/HpaI aldolase/citrate lyase family protein [Yinghuangia soli]|uniref:CoA ester lyase n=1 Tax=Yinghuangia soli TaxID=2908204 RepID=A0AA41Q407_9ACTN|nr:CoA ester lyase [Yinghuangia soli]MCF2530301.1 CoA ester lyase [Yinghuangia soli]
MRSALYVPGDRPDMLAAARARGADALIVDLEDAVPMPAKEAARAAVAAWLGTLPPDTDLPPRATRIWVRVNPGPLGSLDLNAVALPAVAGVCLAKTESAADVAEVDRLLADAPRIAVNPLLESAAAILAAPEIARAPRVARLQVGEADLCADLGVTPGRDERELLWARSQVVLASAAAKIAPPLAPVRTDFRDLAALRTSTEALKRLGFHGRACIHPAQLAVVHEVFTPTAGQLAEARDLLARFESSPSGIVLDPAGRMVDAAVIRHARRTLGEGQSG